MTHISQTQEYCLLFLFKEKCATILEVIFQQYGNDRNTDHDTKVKLFCSETNFKITGYLTFI